MEIYAHNYTHVTNSRLHFILHSHYCLHLHSLPHFTPSHTSLPPAFQSRTHSLPYSNANPLLHFRSLLPLLHSAPSNTPLPPSFHPLNTPLYSLNPPLPPSLHSLIPLPPSLCSPLTPPPPTLHSFFHSTSSLTPLPHSTPSLPSLTPLHFLPHSRVPLDT